MEVWLGPGPPDGTPALWTQHWLILASLTDLSLPPFSFWKESLSPLASFREVCSRVS